MEERLTPHITSKDFRLRCILVPSVHRLISRFSVRSARDFASGSSPRYITGPQLPSANLQAGLLG
jgi:hypothetical protein